ncbi:hypothetical protein C0991_004313, partial [Blastosporella zonata]
MAPTLKFKSAFKLPTRIRPLSYPTLSYTTTTPSTTSPNAINPSAPIVLLRVQILGCSALLAKDRNGLSDPFVTVSLLSERHSTPSVKRTLEPVYAPREATWDFGIPVGACVGVGHGGQRKGQGTRRGLPGRRKAGAKTQQGGGVGALEIVVWDKDMVGKDYLGEAAIPLGAWFVAALGWDDSDNK